MRTRRFLDVWTWGPVLASVLVLTPVAVVLLSWRQAPDEVWHHIVQTLFGELVRHTVLLALCVGSGSLVLGVGLAWFTAVCHFPGRKFFEWALILPFAFPTYVLGYVMLDLLGLSGPVQSYLRRHFPAALDWFPNMQSLLGISMVMIIAFFPYVYLMAHTAFRDHGRRSLEAARSLGHSPTAAFFGVVLPMARPWIFGGLLMVLVETLADFGTVSIFNFDTFTTAIYKAWYGFFSLDTAAQLATILVGATLTLLVLERRLRSRKRFYDVSPAEARQRRTILHGWRGWLLTAICTIVLAAGFALPLGRLLYWSAKTIGQELNLGYWSLVRNTLIVAGAAAVIIAIGALLMSYAARLRQSTWMAALLSLSTMGYALPGTVLAVGIYIPLAMLDNHLSSGLLGKLHFESGTLLNGTILVMLTAYFVRFLAVANQPIQAALTRIRPAMDETARGMGYSRMAILAKVHLPLLRGGMLIATLLVLVEVMKEMPITLMTRPFGWETLAVRIFELTSEGQYHRAALPSIMLVLVGLVPVSLLVKYSGPSKDRQP